VDRGRVWEVFRHSLIVSPSAILGQRVEKAFSGLVGKANPRTKSGAWVRGASRLPKALTSVRPPPLARVPKMSGGKQYLRAADIAALTGARDVLADIREMPIEADEDHPIKCVWPDPPRRLAAQYVERRRTITSASSPPARHKTIA